MSIEPRLHLMTPPRPCPYCDEPMEHDPDHNSWSCADCIHSEPNDPDLPDPPEGPWSGGFAQNH